MTKNMIMMEAEPTSTISLEPGDHEAIVTALDLLFKVPVERLTGIDLAQQVDLRLHSRGIMLRVAEPDGSPSPRRVYYRACCDRPLVSAVQPVIAS